MEDEVEEKEHIVTTWDEMFSEIAYAYESQYCKNLEIETLHDGTKIFNVYKLTILNNGTMEYKGHLTKFDINLWPRVVLFAQLFKKGGAIDVLYGG